MFVENQYTASSYACLVEPDLKFVCSCLRCGKPQCSLSSLLSLLESQLEWLSACVYCHLILYVGVDTSTSALSHSTLSYSNIGYQVDIAKLYSCLPSVIATVEIHCRFLSWTLGRNMMFP